MTPEGKVKKAIREYLDAVSGLYHFAPATWGYGKSGIPDRVLCYLGRFVALEIKPEGKDATKWQAREMKNIRDALGHAIVVRSCADVYDLLYDIHQSSAYRAVYAAPKIP